MNRTSVSITARSAKRLVVRPDWIVDDGRWRDDRGRTEDDREGMRGNDVISLIYLGAIVVLVAIGFVFAFRLCVRAIRDSELDWAAREAEQAHEPALAGAGDRHAH